MWTWGKNRLARWALAVTLFGASSCGSADFALPPVQPGTVQWAMLNVSTLNKQAEANLLRFGNGFVALIDAGEQDGSLLPELRQLKIDRIDAIYVSHVHKDHYAGIDALLDAAIPIGKVFVNVPDREVCDSERPWGCDWEDVQRLLKRLQEKGVPVESMAAGDVVVEDGGTKLEVLWAFDGRETPIGRTDVNDTSVIMRLEHAGTAAIFTGDLNLPLGQHLAERHGEKLRAKILKVPHHGVEGCAPNAFFEAVSPSDALVSTFGSVWHGGRGARVRGVLQRRRIRTHVTSAVGRIHVLFDTTGGYRVKSR